jgi:hypothetical protein
LEARLIAILMDKGKDIENEVEDIEEVDIEGEGNSLEETE